MKLEITSDKKNPLLSRREVEFFVEHDGESTPRKSDVAELLAAKLNAKKELMIVSEYRTQFGQNRTEGHCIVYENKKAMEKSEPDKILNEKKRVGAPKAPEKEEAEEGEKEDEKEEGKKKEKEPAKEEDKGEKDEAQSSKEE